MLTVTPCPCLTSLAVVVGLCLPSPGSSMGDPSVDAVRSDEARAVARSVEAAHDDRDGRRPPAPGQDDGPGAHTAEIYNPPHLFRGKRPAIEDPPAIAPYGHWFPIGTPDGADVRSVVLIKLSSVTHSVNYDQRLVDLPFDADDSGVILARGPAQPTEAPPGYYMLFLVNDGGVPSVAAMVRVEAWTVGDVDADGDVDFADLQRVLAAWGSCSVNGACPADLNDDGVVSLPDLLIILANWS